MDVTEWVQRGVDAARAAGDGVQLTSRRVTVTGAELAARIERAVAGLAAAGMAPDDEVLLGLDPDIDTFVLLCACTWLETRITLIAGIPGSNPLLGRAPTSGRRWIITQPSLYLAGGRGLLAIYLRRLGAQFPDVARMDATHVRTGRRLPLIGKRVVDARGFLGPVGAGGSTPLTPRATNPEAIRRLLLDAGDDGRAVAVRHTGRALAESLAHVEAAVEAGPGDVVFTNEPWAMLAAFAAGAAIDIDPADVIPREVLAHIDGASATHVWLEPSVARRLAVHVDQLDQRLPDAVRHIVLHRDHVDPRTLELLHAAGPELLRISSLYGAAEWFPIAVIGSHERLVWSEDGDLVGPPLAGIETRVSDGVLELRGAGSPVLDPASEGWWHSGDRARIDPEEGIVLLGRASDTLERDGHTWLPALQEAAAERVPGVGFAAFVTRGERSALFVEPDPSSTTPPKELQARLEAALTAELDVVPDEVHVLPRLPRGGRGFRIDRRQLVRWMS